MTLECNDEVAKQMQRAFERKEHERRVWEMHLALASCWNCSPKRNIDLAEHLTAEYEKRMKEKEGGE